MYKTPNITQPPCADLVEVPDQKRRYPCLDVKLQKITHLVLFTDRQATSPSTSQNQCFPRMGHKCTKARIQSWALSPVHDLFHCCGTYEICKTPSSFEAPVLFLHNRGELRIALYPHPLSPGACVRFKEDI